MTIENLSEREIVAKFLKRIRKDAGLTQKQLCARIGMNQGDYSALETGKYVPKSTVIFRIAEALGSRVVFEKI